MSWLYGICGVGLVEQALRYYIYAVCTTVGITDSGYTVRRASKKCFLEVQLSGFIDSLVGSGTKVLSASLGGESLIIANRYYVYVWYQSLVQNASAVAETLFVRGVADKSLARPGRKQVTATKLGIYSTYSPRSSIHFLARCSNFLHPQRFWCSSLFQNETLVSLIRVAETCPLWRHQCQFFVFKQIKGLRLLGGQWRSEKETH